MHIDTLLSGVAAYALAGAQHGQFQQPQLTIGHHQKIATAAGRVKKRQGAQHFVKVKKLAAVVLDALKLGPQFVEKQRLDQLEDVGL